MNIEIRDEREEVGRYTAYLDGRRLGLATWVKVHDTVVLPHTEVDPEWERCGVGSLLARRAFDDARTDGLTVLPFCPFMRRWADLHPDYQDVVRTPRAGELPSVRSAVHAARTLELLADTATAATTLHAFSSAAPATLAIPTEPLTAPPAATAAAPSAPSASAPIAPTSAAPTAPPGP